MKIYSVSSKWHILQVFFILPSGVVEAHAERYFLQKKMVHYCFFIKYKSVLNFSFNLEKVSLLLFASAFHVCIKITMM